MSGLGWNTPETSHICEAIEGVNAQTAYIQLSPIRICLLKNQLVERRYRLGEKISKIPLAGRPANQVPFHTQIAGCHLADFFHHVYEPADLEVTLRSPPHTGNPSATPPSFGLLSPSAFLLPYRS